MGAKVMLIAFIATVIGGLGSVPGAVAAGFLIGGASVVFQATLPHRRPRLPRCLCLRRRDRRPAGAPARVVRTQICQAEGLSSRSAPSVIWRTIATPLILIVALLRSRHGYRFGSRAFNRTVVEMFINIMVVVGLYMFIGNSGLLSFGHISFMCLGAYMTAWLTIPPMMKIVHLKGLPALVAAYPVADWVATPISGVFTALFALIVGRVIMRLSGIAASIATFGLLGVVNKVYSNWESVTGATRLHRRHPAQTMNVWIGWMGAACDRDRLYLRDFPLRAWRCAPPATRRRGQRLRASTWSASG